VANTIVTVLVMDIVVNVNIQMVLKIVYQNNA